MSKLCGRIGDGSYGFAVSKLCGRIGMVAMAVPRQSYADVSETVAKACGAKAQHCRANKPEGRGQGWRYLSAAQIGKR